MMAIFGTVGSLILGLLIGWVLGSRPLAEWQARFAARDGEARELDEQFRRAITELAAASVKAGQHDALAEEITTIREERDTLAAQFAAAHERASEAERMRAELATVRTDRENLRAELERLKADADGFSEKTRLLVEAQESLRKEFENAGSKVLERAQETFLTRANARFEESEKAQGEKLKSLLEPVGERLKSYEEQVSKLERDRVDAFGNLAGLIEGMRKGQEEVRSAAAQLGNSLRNGPKTQGRWGEIQLKNLLEQCGLAERTDFVKEHSVDTDEGRLRPDAIVRIPGNKLLVIDAKVSLNDYQESLNASDDITRDRLLDKHVSSMKSHIQTLASKSYQSQFPESPDYVIMFVPGEHFITAALEHDSRKRSMSLEQGALLRDPDLWNYAFDRRVLLAGPTNLVAIARTIAQVWRQDGLAQEAKEIGRLGAELHDRIAKVTEDLVKVGSNLGRAVSSYNDFVRSFETRVSLTGKRLRDKHIEIGKRDIEDVPLIETLPRHAEGGGESPKLALVEPGEGEQAAE